MGKFGDTVSKVRTVVNDWVNGMGSYEPGSIPSDAPKDRERMSSFVVQLYKDSLSWREDSFFNRLRQFKDPIAFWRDCRKLEAGMHWDVWGRRNVEAGTEWMHELVDNEIGSQVRVRKSYMTANFHDISIMPNIKNIGQILDQERKATGWGKVTIQAVHKALVEGTAIIKSIFDTTEDPDGQAREIVCDNAGIFPSPYATSFAARDGCWYVIHATLQSNQWIAETYPDFKGEIGEPDSQRAKDISMTSENANPKSLVHTRFSDHLECWMDDKRLEDVPYDLEETDLEHAAIHNGTEVTAFEDQNHKKHVAAHMDWINELSTKYDNQVDNDLTDDDIEFGGNIIEYTLLHVKDHISMDRKSPKSGKRYKYPHGRKTVVVGGQVVQDIPNKFGIDWRRLFHKYDCETIPEHFWGRGVPEVLWETNKAEDTMICRIADTAISTSMPAPWLSQDDKENIEKQNITNDPTKFKYYIKSPPEFPQGQSPRENLEIYQLMKNVDSKQLGVNNVTFGEAPSAQSSGKMVNTLLQQNIVIVTGEANMNFNDIIEDVVETRIALWKRFYTEPRNYFIDGQIVTVRLSELLSKHAVMEDGQPVEKDIPDFQITVKPNSNFPNQWEVELQFLLQMAGMTNPDGTPYIPRRMVMDILSQKYPELAENGKYYLMSQIEQLGQQAYQQQEARKEQEQRDIRDAAQQFKQSAVGKVMRGEPTVKPGEGVLDETQEG